MSDSNQSQTTRSSGVAFFPRWWRGRDMPYSGRFDWLNGAANLTQLALREKRADYDQKAAIRRCILLARSYQSPRLP